LLLLQKSHEILQQNAKSWSRIFPKCQKLSAKSALIDLKRIVKSEISAFHGIFPRQLQFSNSRHPRNKCSLMTGIPFLLTKFFSETQRHPVDPYTGQAMRS